MLIDLFLLSAATGVLALMLFPEAFDALLPWGDEDDQ